MDHDVPDRMKIWSVIENELHGGKRKSGITISFRKLAIAASFILISLAAGLFYYQTNQQMQTIALEQNELRDINVYYTQLINYKIEKVKANSELSEDDKEEFLQYFEELERECQKLEIEFKVGLDNEVVLEAIVNNYRQRLNLLENLLNRLNRSKEYKDENSISL